MQQHELADVVQQARDGQAVAVLVADLRGDPIGRVLGGERVQAEALGRGSHTLERSKKSKVPHACRERLHRLGAEQLDGRDDRVDRPRCPAPGWPAAARR